MKMVGGREKRKLDKRGGCRECSRKGAIAGRGKQKSYYECTRMMRSSDVRGMLGWHLGRSGRR